ncbi:MAG: nuclear transport factor 2 family protein [Geobacteraceae bacterium]|nr:nuclear transport factor 2 family protein [Geobacteraceae bacterium]
MADEKLKVIETMQRYLDAYSKKDLEGCLELFAEQTPLLMLGTNDDEIIPNRRALADAYLRDFSMMDNIALGSVRQRHVEVGADLASILLELPLSYTAEGDQTTTLFRFAFTMVRENGAWKISAGLVSVPFKSGTYSFY